MFCDVCAGSVFRVVRENEEEKNEERKEVSFKNKEDAEVEKKKKMTYLEVHVTKKSLESSRMIGETNHSFDLILS